MQYEAWVVRLPLISKGFRAKVAQRAKQNGMSVGEYVTAVLEEKVGSMPSTTERKKANVKGNV